jgi:hypothetical protein
MKLYPPPPNKILFYENVAWDGNIKKTLGRYTNGKHCLAVDLILKHNQKGSRFGRVIQYIITFYS